MERLRSSVVSQRRQNIFFDVVVVVQLAIYLVAGQYHLHGVRFERWDLPLCAFAVLFYSRRLLLGPLESLSVEQTLNAGSNAATVLRLSLVALWAVNCTVLLTKLAGDFDSVLISALCSLLPLTMGVDIWQRTLLGPRESCSASDPATFLRKCVLGTIWSVVELVVCGVVLPMYLPTEDSQSELLYYSPARGLMLTPLAAIASGLLLFAQCLAEHAVELQLAVGQVACWRQLVRGRGGTGGNKPAVATAPWRRGMLYPPGTIVSHLARTWEFAPRNPTLLASSGTRACPEPGLPFTGLLELCFADVAASMLWVRIAMSTCAVVSLSLLYLTGNVLELAALSGAMLGFAACALT